MAHRIERLPHQSHFRKLRQHGEVVAEKRYEAVTGGNCGILCDGDIAGCVRMTLAGKEHRQSAVGFEHNIQSHAV